VDRGSVPVPVGSMGTAGADRSAAEIAAELSHVQSLRLDGRRIKNLLYIHRLGRELRCTPHPTPPPSAQDIL
jgi:hypothetical protein